MKCDHQTWLLKMLTRLRKNNNKNNNHILSFCKSLNLQKNPPSWYDSQVSHWESCLLCGKILPTVHVQTILKNRKLCLPLLSLHSASIMTIVCIKVLHRKTVVLSIKSLATQVFLTVYSGRLVCRDHKDVSNHN